MITLLLLFNLSFANQCQTPFPLHLSDKVISACLKFEKVQKVGHLLFIQMPRATYSSDSSATNITYFSNTEKTRKRLCRIFNMKRDMGEYTLYDKSNSSIAYSQNGFNIEKQANTLKMLACSLL